jgi:protein-tyrosine phosphatase
VERAAVFQDYLKTNDHFAPLTPRIERMMKIFSLGRLQMENVRASLSAREDYLQAALDQIDQRYGGITAYLAKCGVTAYEVETLRGLLLE